MSKDSAECFVPQTTEPGELHSYNGANGGPGTTSSYLPRHDLLSHEGELSG